MGFNKKDDRETRELNNQYQQQIDQTNAELEEKRASISREKLAILKSHTESWAPEVFRPSTANPMSKAGNRNKPSWPTIPKH